MFKNNFKIALRNLRKQKAYSFINISGLSVGIACFLLIILYVKDELSYDRFHEKAERIYRVTFLAEGRYGEAEWASMLKPTAPKMKETFPEVENYVRLSKNYDALVRYGTNRFYEDRFLLADPTFFDVFDFALLQGDKQTALTRPYTVVITKQTAEKYFGDEDPIGQTLTVDNENNYEVTGIIEDSPHNSHFQYDFIGSLLSEVKEPGVNEWYRLAFSYILLDENAETGQIIEKIPEFKKAYFPENFSKSGIKLLPLTDIHLYTHYSSDIAPQGDIRYIYLFSVIAFLILLIACINYMNLATARSSQRAREIGMRKVIGAQRYQLIRQFLSESLLISIFAALLSIVIVELFLPTFNILIDRELSISYQKEWDIFLILVGVVLFVGLLSGSYPAFYLSAFQPVKVLKGIFGIGQGGFFRKSLVLFQFAISVLLILCTMVIQSQLDFMQTENLGFDREHVIVIRTQKQLDQSAVAFKTSLLNYPGIENVSLTFSIPGKPDAISTFKEIEGVESPEKIIFDHFISDYDFFQTIDVKIENGRKFSNAFSTDVENAILINETAVQTFGWENPIGKYIGDKDKKRIVVGVVKDFHNKSFKTKIDPAVFTILTRSPRYVAVKIRTIDIRGVLDFLENQWDTFVPSHPFQYSFLDDDFDALYRSEERLSYIFVSFSFIAVMIACLGLFGLASFTVEQRTKEIGIRKVLGASVLNIVHLLTKEYIKLVIIANVIVWPVAYFVLEKWLQNFVYRINLEIPVFVITGATLFLITFLTVSYQAIKTAIANPVETLRYE